MLLETKRLFLREFVLSDAKHLFELNSDPEVIKYTGDPPFNSKKSAEIFLNNYKDYRNNGYGRWAVVLKQDNTFVGWCGLKLNEEGFIDIGFRFFRRFWNNGYATESAKATLKYGLDTLGLKMIIGRVSEENQASIRVLEKLNMKFWKKGTCSGIPVALYYRVFKD